MEDSLKKIYGVYMVFIIVVLFYVLNTFKVDTVSTSYKKGYEKITNYKTESVKYSKSPSGTKEVYILPGQKVEGAYRHLMIYSVHQTVEVYVGSTLLYSMKSNPSNFGKTPGCIWNDIVLLDRFLGEEIRVEITPAYANSVKVRPLFYFGTKLDIIKSVLLDAVLRILLSLVLVVIGIGLIVYVFYNRMNSEISKDIAFRGVFAIHIGLWRFFDLPAAKLLLMGKPAVSMAPFMAILLSIVPFLFIFQDIVKIRKRRLWDIWCWILLAGVSLCGMLQYMDMVDFRESFIVSVILLIGTSALISSELYQDVRSYGWSEKMKQNAMFVVVCMVGVGMDILCYLVSGRSKTTDFGMIAFLVYLILISVDAAKDAKELAVAGMQSKNYERMAYRDQLTGLYNRTALAVDTDRYTFDPSHCIYLVFDLNDLKKCNDQLGHEQGDIYIKDSARLIQSTFELLGKCYRTGGDEFCCIVEKASLKDVKETINELRRRYEEYNIKSPIVKISISVGYAVYDERLDYDITETSKRADKMMYEDKARIKKERAEKAGVV